VISYLIFSVLLNQPISKPWVNLDDLGLPQPGPLCLTRYQDSIYLVGYREGVVLKLDMSGKLEARYEAAGLGPMELEHPSIFGVNDEGVFLLTQQTRIVHLTHNLEPMGIDYPRLPFRVFKGISTGPGRFLADSPLAPTPAAVTELTLENGQWHIGRHTGPMAPRLGTRYEDLVWHNAENGWVFVYVGTLANQNTIFSPQNIARDTYSVKAYRSHAGDTEPVLVLQSNVKNLLPDQGLLSIAEVIARPNGFAVSLRATTPKLEVTGSWIDLFDAKGKQVSRITSDKSFQLYSVENAPLDVVFYPDDATLEIFSLD